MECYPLVAPYNYPPWENSYCQIPNTLDVTSGNNILGYPVSPNTYDQWLQNNGTFSLICEY